MSIARACARALRSGSRITSSFWVSSNATALTAIEPKLLRSGSIDCRSRPASRKRNSVNRRRCKSKHRRRAVVLPGFGLLAAQERLHGQTRDIHHHCRHLERHQALKLIGESCKDDSQDCHCVDSRIFRVGYHCDARIGRKGEEIHGSPASILPVI